MIWSTSSSFPTTPTITSSTMTKSPAFVSCTPLQKSCFNSISSSKLCTITNRNYRVPPQRRASFMNPTMGLFGLGTAELLVIAGVGILIFGPSKVAELGKDLGGIAGGVKKASAEFKEAMQESLEEADKEIEQRRIEKNQQQETTTTTTTTTTNASQTNIPASDSNTQTTMATSNDSTTTSDVKES